MNLAADENKTREHTALSEKQTLSRDQEGQQGSSLFESSFSHQETPADSEQISRLKETIHFLEQQLTESGRQIACLENEVRSLRHLIDSLRHFLQTKSGLLSFRAARLLQIFNNPQLIGSNSRLSVLSRMLFSFLTGKEFAPDYRLFQEAAVFLENGSSSASSAATAPENTDGSVLISVILPVYNQADLVHESISSVLAQSYQNWELIIVNDGSTDHLAEAVAPFLKDPRIRYLEQKNQKLPKALSNGFSFARGEFLTWTSADNNMHPQMLSKLSAFLSTHPDSDMVYADYLVIDDHGDPLTEAWFRPQNKLHPESPELHLPRSTQLLNIVQDNFIGACFMYRRSVLQLLGDYDPQLGVEDYDYWMRVNAMLKISHLGTDELLYSYRVHENSLNAQAAELKIAEKCQRLMDYEKERHAFYFKPFEIYSTFLETDFLYGRFNYRFHGEKYTGSAPAEKFGKRVLICRGKELSDFSIQELERYNFIGAYFDHGSANDAGKNAYLIRRFRIQCFSRSGSPESRRLALITNNCLECDPPQAGFFTLAAANNRIFFETTRPAEERRRTLPLVRENTAKKILILLGSIGNGGMEQVAYDMTASFRKQGRQVLLASFQAPEKDVEIPSDITPYILSADDPEKDLKELLEKESYAAVFAHHCPRGAEISHKMQVPFFQIIHNTYVWFGEKEISQYTAADAFTTACIAVSATAAWYAAECLALPPEKMIIIENAVETRRYTYSEEGRRKLRRELNIDDDTFLLLNPASVYGAKGQLNLLLAFAQARQNNPKLHLLIAGKILEPAYFRTLQKIISEHDLQEAVTIDRFFENMAGVYSAADAVVFSSYWEGCSLAVAEAVRMKKPLLSPRVGDVERQTDGRNCILFDLPWEYLTELNGLNCGAVIYTPNQPVINSLAQGMTDLAAGRYLPPCPDHPAELSADEVYGKYLKVMNYCSGDLKPEAFRHNL